MLAKSANDNAFILNQRSVLELFASKLVPTGLIPSLVKTLYNVRFLAILTLKEL